MKVDFHTICISIAIVIGLFGSRRALGQESKSTGAAIPEPQWIVSEKITRKLATTNLRDLVLSRDDDVATHAAWRRVEKRLLVPHSSGQSTSVEETAPYFIGFLEGRLAVSAPPTWKDAVQSVRRDRHGRIVFELARVDKGRDRVDGLLPPAGVAVTVDDTGKMRVDLAGREVVISKRIKDVCKSRCGAIGFAVCADNEAAYLAWYSSQSNVLVSCIRDGDELWSVPINGNWYSGDASGPGAGQAVDLVLSENAIGLFAVSPSVVYMEVLEKGTGLCRARFSTSAYHVP